MRWLYSPAPAWTASVGLLLVRIVVGWAFILHGWPKLQSPTTWMGPLGVEPPVPAFLQAVAAGVEVVGGAALILGLLTRVAAVALMAQMVAALALVHIPRGDPFVAVGQASAELAVVYLATSVLLLVLGPGLVSLDALLFSARPRSLPGSAYAPPTV